MPEPARIHITPVGGRASLRLKAWQPNYANAAKPVVLAGRELPSKVGATLSGPMRVLCVGPGDWLIVSQEQQGSSLLRSIEPELQAQGLAMADVSDGLVALEVRGSATREVLSKGCGLDMHPRSFPPGRCARTRFAQIAVVIECLEDPARFELHVARSHLRYLHSWLTDAAVEFEASDVNS